jgi:hypothetical protein
MSKSQLLARLPFQPPLNSWTNVSSANCLSSRACRDVKKGNVATSWLICIFQNLRPSCFLQLLRHRAIPQSKPVGSITVTSSNLVAKMGRALSRAFTCKGHRRMKRWRFASQNVVCLVWCSCSPCDCSHERVSKMRLWSEKTSQEWQIKSLELPS